MIPTWNAPSEVWLPRMMEMLGNDLNTIIVNSADGSSSWGGRTRIVSIHQYHRHFRYVTRIARQFGIDLLKAEREPNAVISQEVTRSEISCIFCHYGTYAVNFLEVWRRIDKPLFVHFHGYDATIDLRISERPNEKAHNPYYLAQILELSTLATLIANSEYTKANLISHGVSEERVIVKYLGVPLPDRVKKHERRKGVRILHLGRLIDCKSPDRTILAFELARKMGLDGELWIAGDGPLKVTCELLRLRSPYKESIHIFGAVSSSQAEKLLGEADIFTQHNIVGELSRQSEAFGVSIVEAMSHGLPVVGTKNGGVVETVLDGLTGTLVTPGDIEAQAKAFLLYANDPHLRQQMGSQARKRVEEHFTLDQEKYRLRSILGLTTV